MTYPVHSLRSPIALYEAPILISKSCSSRRRTTKLGSHALRRRRGHSRLERATHPFDQLPWISALESPPKQSGPWDVADLSLLPTDSKLGPVRRRKSSLRSSPLDVPVDLPILLEQSISPPVTPKSSPILPSRILFQSLMPVSPSCINIQL